MKAPGESPKTYFFRIKGRQFASATIGEVLRVMGGILPDLIGVVQYQIHAFDKNTHFGIGTEKVIRVGVPRQHEL
jgi:hypothetical protein